MRAATADTSSATLRTLLRSLGQIVLQPNAFTGACLLAAWLLADPRLACAALMGAISANVSAILADDRGHPTREDEIRSGLHGFNGALAGLAAFSFIADPATAAAVAILAATATAWLLNPMSRWLRVRGMGYFSSPCLIVTWLWLPMLSNNLAPTGAGQIHVAQAANAAHAALTSDALQRGGALLAGFAQTGFASGALPGLLVLIGIAVASRRHAFAAVVGAALANALHLLLHASPGSFDAGLLGFNGALTALALIDVGVVPMLGGVVISVVLQAAATQLGWPALTAPFVIATWSVQWLGRRIALPPGPAKPGVR
ncbi:urea transporter [Paraburkholderia metrosideri]|uniref:Urea transporter n=1 Tax=Paraburkholderia metrosideri TaxID=580937 RepID=A0ABM8P485_9BURK|nr:urea transporter [Paraburkholderia metrosideri]CAD6555976.1 Urea transporter [Paraburkholderia metrosideri]